MVWGGSEQTWDCWWKHARCRGSQGRLPQEAYFSSKKTKQTKRDWRGHRVKWKDRRDQADVDMQTVIGKLT